MQSLADEHCNPPYHLTWHCIFPSTFFGGLGIFLSGVFPLGRFLGSVFSSSSLPLTCCGKACSRIIPCRVCDVRLSQMDRSACYQVVYLMVAGVTAPYSLCLFFIHVPFHLHQPFG